MTVYRKNPLLMTVMGANPGGPAFVVLDSADGCIVYRKKATKTGDEAIRSCTKVAQRLANQTGRNHIIFLELSGKRVGECLNLRWVMTQRITDEIYPYGIKSNPPRRRRPDDAIDKAIGHAWAQLMSGVQVPIMDIPRIFRDIKLEMAGGVTLEQAVTAVGSRYRVNRNPGGLGAAVMGGIAGAVANRVMSNPPSGPVDETAARELELYIENDGDLYRQQFIPIVKNLMKRRMKGGYNRELAVKLFMYLVDNGAKKYIREFGTRDQRIDAMFNRNTRLDVARSLRDKFEAEAELGNYDKTTWGVSNNPHRNPRSGSVLITTPSQLEAGKVAGWLRREKVDALVDVHRGEWGVFVPPNQFGRARHALNLVLSKNPSRHRRGSTRPASNPGRSTRKTTMPIARFAALVKKQNDPALWRDFVAKCRAYHKWSHGSWPTKVTVERINKPGVKGLWIVFDMGKQPESTYVMPKGSKRKGAWKHPWTRMPSMKGDPQAGMIITKLVSGNRLQEFLHG